MGTTHRLATHGEEVIMKFFAVLPSLLAAVSAEAFLPITAQALPAAGLYAGNAGLAAPYAPAYANVETRFAYNQPITAINAGPLTAGPVAAAVPAYTAAAPAAAVPAYTAAAPVIGAQYAAAYSAPAITAPVCHWCLLWCCCPCCLCCCSCCRCCPYNCCSFCHQQPVPGSG